MSVRIVPIDVGTLPSPQAWVTGEGGLLGMRPGAPSIDLALVTWVLQHPAHGPVLVDTGLHPDALRDLRADMGRFSAYFFRTLRANGEFGEQLRAAGVEPAQVRRVVMTHLHGDHTSGMRLLPEARFTIARDDWDAAHGRLAAPGAYVAKHLPPAERVDLVDGDADVLGDGTIRVLATPGHSAGHLAVHVETPSGPVLLAGDAVYTLRNLDEDLRPLRCVDADAYRLSVARLRAWREDHPGRPVIPSHEPRALELLDLA